MRQALVVAMVVFIGSCIARGQAWTDQVRGSWVRQGDAQQGDFLIADEKSVCDIFVGKDENSAVQHAAACLASDIQKISGKKPAIVNERVAGHRAIEIRTESPNGTDKWIWKFGPGAWEAYEIKTGNDDVQLVGSDFRGAAYAAYTLSERLGIDPLYLWTGYVPEHHTKLVLKSVDEVFQSPTIKYRGMFHDDEDILPRPFENSGYPLRVGDVPLEWYEKYFETALRLRMNMVAPWTRVHRRYEVQKTASDWGLFYTSHHYDILLSNPYGFERYGLGEKRHAGNDWNWETNREGILNYWRGGVEENKDLYCIWPVGLRGTDDVSYKFPPGATEQEKLATFKAVIDAQVKMADDLLPADKPRLFHFTMYNEMLNEYLKDPSAFALPENVIIVWVDDNDGRMRFLPKNLGKWKHGVYYHLAYLGPVSKQNSHIVTPAMIGREFRKVVDSGATEYLLFNVSELREFVMEARMLAEIGWDAKTALADTPPQPMPDKPLPATPSTKESRDAASQPSSNPSGERYVAWWCREYFGADAAPEAARVYHQYYELLNSFDKQWFGSGEVQKAINLLMKGDGGTLDTAELRERERRYAETFQVVDEARRKMDRQQKQFFFDHAELPMLMDWRPTQAALVLADALAEREPAKRWTLCEKAMAPLEQLEVEIARAEHPPFELWYRKTWIRRENKDLNVHRPYEQLRAFLSSGGRAKLEEPRGAARPVFPVRKD